MIISLLIVVATLFDSSPPDNWSIRLAEKVDATVKSTFALDAYEMTDQSEHLLPRTNGEHAYLFSIEVDQQRKGFLYVDQANSMKDVFDYAVVFDPDLTILNAKVLIYREQHGRQIGTKRWLSQFFGMTPADRPQLNESIDGISGATISVTNMTNAVRDLLSDLDVHKDELTAL